MITIFLCFFSATSILSQEIFPPFSRGKEELRLPDQSPLVLFDVLNFISEESGKSRLDIHYRISYDFFVFVKNIPFNASSPYIARTEIGVEILDKNNMSVAREFVRKEIKLLESPSQTTKQQFLEGMLSLNLPPGEYSLVTEVNDLESTRKYLDTKKKVTLKNFSNDSLEVSDILFLELLSRNDSTILTPINHGGDVPFGRNFDGYFEVSLGNHSDDSLRIEYALTKYSSERRSFNPVLGNEANVYSQDTSIRLEHIEDEFRYSAAGSYRKGKYGCWLHFRGDTLRLGDYELEVKVYTPNFLKSEKRKFRIRWFDMPLSLRNLQFAIDALEYIAPDSILEQLRKARGEKQQQLFEEFWRQRDKTPTTTFNEVMEEYYRRVDYAYMNLNTIRERNGAKTDRGKAYILYGPPAKIVREFAPSLPPKEIWYYPNLQKKLIFIDESRKGEYKLLTTAEL
ncbi:MAG: GWxTD domain-containing protein [Ignavibacteriae bacterium]|nr:GWxTD domain-containing protein [Ignavibacteriota bacterium]